MKFFPAKTVEQALERLHDASRAERARALHNYGCLKLSAEAREAFANIETPPATQAFVKKEYRHVPR